MRDQLSPEQEAEVGASSEPVASLMVRYGVGRKTIERIKTRMPRKNAYASRERAIPYMLWVKSLPCLMTTPLYDMLMAVSNGGAWDRRYIKCTGPTEADHAGERIAGLNTKSLDRDVIPLCAYHHAQRTDYRGLFANISIVDRRSWCDLAIASVHRHALNNGITVPEC